MFGAYSVTSMYGLEFMFPVTMIYLPHSSMNDSLSWKDNDFLKASSTPLFLLPGVKAINTWGYSLCEQFGVLFFWKWVSCIQRMSALCLQTSFHTENLLAG